MGESCDMKNKNMVRTVWASSWFLNENRAFKNNPFLEKRECIFCYWWLMSLQACQMKSNDDTAPYIIARLLYLNCVWPNCCRILPFCFHWIDAFNNKSLVMNIIFYIVKARGMLILIPIFTFCRGIVVGSYMLSLPLRNWYGAIWTSSAERA